MTDRTLRRAFIALHLTVAAAALVQGTQTLIHAAHDLAGHQLILVLGVLQLVAGILFLLPGMLRYGGPALVVIFVHEVLFGAMHGEFSMAPLVYAAAALFVTLHGAAWRAARPVAVGSGPISRELP